MRTFFARFLCVWDTLPLIRRSPASRQRRVLRRLEQIALTHRGVPQPCPTYGSFVEVLPLPAGSMQRANPEGAPWYFVDLGEREVAIVWPSNGKDYNRCESIWNQMTQP
jgi:hypothetical protein